MSISILCRVLAFTSLSILCGASYSQSASDVVCNGCVGGQDIASGAVTNSKIANNAVTNGKIQNSAVSTAKLQNSSVTIDKLAPDVKAAIIIAGAPIPLAYIQSTDILAALALCPSGTVATSASCACDTGAFDDRNYGVLFACQLRPDKRGATAGCFNESYSFSPFKGDTRAIVEATCINGSVTAQSDGEPVQPQVHTINPEDDPAYQKIRKTAIEHAERLRDLE